VLGWALLAALWRPDPPISFLEAPSASPEPPGHAVFHDLLARRTPGVRRLLGRASQLPQQVGVLVVLAPGEPVPASHRREMLEWAAEPGRVLVVGHPILDEERAWLDAFDDGADGDGWTALARWERFGARTSIDAGWSTGFRPEAGLPAVQGFGHAYRGALEPVDSAAEPMLLGAGGEVLAAMQPHGEGWVVQLAAADLLDNRALGWKKTHEFAATLIEAVGTGTEWAIDESHEGIEQEPSLVRLIGSGPWRGVLLQVLLLGLFGYWWATARLGRPRAVPPAEHPHAATTLARDMGDFALRAQKSRWALERTLEHLRLVLGQRKVESTAREQAAQAAALAAREIESGQDHLERHARLMTKMAIAERRLLESGAGKGRKR
ncbi:MAG TPA: DUF4350 domain-containing protein, partial [Polyangia bacterium]|nr:DUF4350 domain-containing protein [Polyangia bacterium]